MNLKGLKYLCGLIILIAGVFIALFLGYAIGVYPL
jgi:hypothetical protein